MLIEIIWQGRSSQVDLSEGMVSLGGSKHDAVLLEGLEPGFVSLWLDHGQLKVTAQKAICIGKALFPARIPRLVVEGEDMLLPQGIVVRQVATQRPSRNKMATAMVAQQLLAGDVAPQETRAATLTCVTGNDQGKVFLIPFGEHVLGRGYDAQIRIKDRSVSRKQATLSQNNRGFVLRALEGSTNSVYVNGVAIARAVLLKTGDLIEVGLTVLRFDAGAEEATLTEPERDEPEIKRSEAPRARRSSRQKPGSELRIETVVVSTALFFTLLGAAVAVVVI